jgi:hypothetical protein
VKTFKITYDLYCKTRTFLKKEIKIHNCTDFSEASFKLTSYLKRTYLDYVSHKIMECDIDVNLENLSEDILNEIILMGGISVDFLNKIKKDGILK